MIRRFQQPVPVTIGVFQVGCRWRRGNVLGPIQAVRSRPSRASVKSIPTQLLNSPDYSKRIPLAMFARGWQLQVYASLPGHAAMKPPNTSTGRPRSCSRGDVAADEEPPDSWFDGWRGK